jgi:hypothetical protein
LTAIAGGGMVSGAYFPKNRLLYEEKIFGALGLSSNVRLFFEVTFLPIAVNAVAPRSESLFKLDSNFFSAASHATSCTDSS